MNSDNTKVKNNLSAVKLLMVACAMFAFGYALVPLYDLLCDITGLGGKTGEISQVEASEVVIDESRIVTIEFASTSAVNIPWDFKPKTSSVEVNPGKVTLVNYYVKNRSSFETVGQAIPSVTPAEASKYFNKTECFCFSMQTLEGKEEKDMPVQFIVDPNLPEYIKTITLGYTFFNSEKYAQN